MNLELWKCPTCNNKSVMGVKICRKCRTAQPPGYTVDDTGIVPKVAEVTKPASGTEFLTNEAKRRHTNRNNRIVNKIKPGGEDQLFTSTMGN